MKNKIPRVIWLQIKDDDGEELDEYEYTWSYEPIQESDIKYIIYGGKNGKKD
jgi:hypothetical protein